MSKWILILVGCYGALVLAAYLFQRTLMYFPDPSRIAPASAGLPQAQEVMLNSADGETLLAWRVAPAAGKPLILYFQGNAGGLDLRVARFKKLIADGTGLLALSYRGYSGSTGTPSESGLIADAQAAYDYAAAQFAGHPLVAFGESLGTGVAVALASERKVAGVILDAPFTSAADVGAAAYPFLPVRWLIRDRFDSSARIGKIRAPILVLHGAQDRIVPMRFGESLFALAGEPKRFVRFAEGGHVNLDDYGAMDAIHAFLAEIEKG